MTQLALWIPEWDGEPGYWEEDFPVTCLKDEDGDWYMSRVYDTKTGVMMDAQGTYDFDWDAIGLFD